MKIQTTIESKIKNALNPTYLTVHNESHMHSVPPGSESHFKVVVVTETFVGKNLVKRHQMINKILKEELENHIHALALHTFTPDEWEQKQQANDSPECLGGSKQD